VGGSGGQSRWRGWWQRSAGAVATSERRPGCRWALVACRKGLYARARDAAGGGREGIICSRPGVCAVWVVGGCWGVAVVSGALGCCQGWRVQISSLRGRGCGHLATGRRTMARPRLVCPHERSDPVVLPVSVRSRHVSDRPASMFGHTPPHERYVTQFNDPGSWVEMTHVSV